MAREIAKHGSVLAKVDGPYGVTSPLLQGQCRVAVLFAGGIGVSEYFARHLLKHSPQMLLIARPAGYAEVTCLQHHEATHKEAADAVMLCIAQFATAQGAYLYCARLCSAVLTHQLMKHVRVQNESLSAAAAHLVPE